MTRYQQGGTACYVVAEAGSNHDGKLEQAHRLVDVAADAGADAVKFQLFQAAKLYPRAAGSSDYLGLARSIYDVVRELETPAAWLPELFAHCRARGIEFLASAFDEASVDRVDPFVAAHKCASYELTHHPLLAHLATRGKPLFVSTGTADLDEVAQAVAVTERAGNRQVVLLQCTASYPTPIDQVNLRAMQTLEYAFGLPVGLSDHSREPAVAPAAAAALGARVIEKHFTLSNALPGPDHRFALEPHELAAMVAAIRATERALGDGRKVPLPVEDELRRFARRSIFTVRPIRAGEPFDPSNIAVLRCGKLRPGLPPSDYPRVLGRTCRRDLQPEVSVTHDDVSE